MGRRAGTKGNRFAYRYLCGELEFMGFQYDTDSSYTENGNVIRNIIVTLPGYIDSTVIIGAHFDGAVESYEGVHYSAAEDNGSGVVTLLMLLKRFKDGYGIIERTIKCCFWDSEESFEGRAFRGSTHYAQQLSATDKLLTLFYLNLDTIGHNHSGSNEIYFDYYGTERTAQSVETIADNQRFEYHVSERKTQLVSDYASFYKIGVPYLSFHDHSGFTCKHANHSVSDTPDAISVDRLLKITSNVIDLINIY